LPLAVNYARALPLETRMGGMRVVTIATAWYASGTFWTAAGVMIALLVGAASIRVAYIVGFPRRRLLYAMPTVGAMLTAPAGVRGDLELRHRGKVLTAPGVVEVWLVSRGRKDIPSSAYDSRKPLRLDVGAGIVEVLHVTSDPPSIPKPKVTVEDTSLAIGPSLIGKRQKITFTLLTDGGRPHLTCESTLIDVQVREQDLDDLRPGPGFAVTFATVAALAAIATVFSLATASSQRAIASAAGAAASVAAGTAVNDESTSRAAVRAAAVAKRAAAAATQQAKASATKRDSFSARAADASAAIADLQSRFEVSAANSASAAADRDRATARMFAANQAAASATAQTYILRARAFGATAAVAAIAALAVWLALLRRSSRR